jgi:hypothetical protein
MHAPIKQQGPSHLAWMMLPVLVLCGCKEPVLTGQMQPVTEASVADPDDLPITEADVPVPADFAEAVERIGGYRDAIRQAVESGRLADAHRPLDETNIAVDRLPSIARSSDVPRRDWEQVVVVGEDLAEALDEIHTDIDAGRTPDYAARAEAIDSAIGRLQAVAETNRNNQIHNETNR